MGIKYFEVKSSPWNIFITRVGLPLPWPFEGLHKRSSIRVGPTEALHILL